MRPRTRRFLWTAVAAGGLLALAGCGGGGSGGEVDAPHDDAPDVVLALTPTTGTAPLEVRFDATASSDPAGGSLAFAWDFGNGEVSAAPSGTVTYPSPGVYTVRVTVTGSAGAAADGEATVRVAAPSGSESPAERVVYLTNLERRAQGLPPVKAQANLAAAAVAHAEDMAALDYFAHDSADGRTPWDRLRAAGYDYGTAGENIAAGYATPEAVVQAWMNSPGHRANILNGGFRELGAGHAFEAGDAFPGPYGYHHYWVQDFGTRSAVFPLVIADEAYETSQAAVELYLYGTGWAAEMMLSEEPDFAGAVWVPFSPEVSWTLSPGAGVKTVCARLRQGTAVRTACDEIRLR